MIGVSNPACPKIIGSMDTPSWASHVSIVGTTAYAAADNAGLQVINVSNSANPRIIGYVDTES